MKHYHKKIYLIVFLIFIKGFLDKIVSEIFNIYSNKYSKSNWNKFCLFNN